MSKALGGIAPPHEEADPGRGAGRPGGGHGAQHQVPQPHAGASLNPAAFNAKTYVQTNFPKIRSTLTEKATDIVVLAPAVDKDPAAAAKKYGTDVGSGKYAFPVKATGTVKEVDENFMLVAVPGVPAGDKVRIPLGFAITGTPVRDATGGMTFSDFSGQTDYQSVANELKVKIRADVDVQAGPAVAQGQEGDRRRCLQHRWAAQLLHHPARVDRGVMTAAAADEQRGDVVLRAVDISKTYGVTRALKGVNFDVHRGKVTALFGENGAGKSTLMKILSGVEQPDLGRDHPRRRAGRASLHHARRATAASRSSTRS